MTSKEALEKLRYNYFNTKNDDETEFQNLCDRIGNDQDVLEIFRRGYGDTNENKFYTIQESYSEYEGDLYTIDANYADFYPSSMELTKDEYTKVKEWLEK